MANQRNKRTNGFGKVNYNIIKHIGVVGLTFVKSEARELARLLEESFDLEDIDKIPEKIDKMI